MFSFHSADSVLARKHCLTKGAVIKMLHALAQLGLSICLAMSLYSQELEINPASLESASSSTDALQQSSKFTVTHPTPQV